MAYQAEHNVQSAAVIGGGLSDELKQATFSAGLKGVKPDDVPAVEALVQSTLAQVASAGFDADAIEASMNTVEFSLREFNTGGFPKGLSLMLAVMPNWLYERGTPTDALRFEAPLAALKKRLAAGETEEELLEEAFAVVREAAWRTLDLRHYDVQLVGAMALNDGKLAQMGTGEGKTLVATGAVYLNALSGKGAMVVTVNDYLARRDAEGMGQVYAFLGLSVGLVQSGSDTAARREAYSSDVTYVTNSELGFDYLRDNLAEIGRASCRERV